jgi:adenine-specific DNA-methyltransferase
VSSTKPPLTPQTSPSSSPSRTVPRLLPVPELNAVYATPAVEALPPENLPTITLIEGENSAVLDLLKASNATFDVIYVDPPYNTGRPDFPYRDTFAATNSHAAWLAFIRPRLIAASKMLSPGGYLAISIDDNEYPRLRLLLDEIFEERNVKTVVVKTSEPAGIKMASSVKAGSFPKLKEYLLFAGFDLHLTIPLVPKDRWDPAYTKYVENFTPQMRQQVDEAVASPSLANAQALETTLASVSFVPLRTAATQQGVDVKDHAAYNAWRYDNAWRIARVTNGVGSIKAYLANRAQTTPLPSQLLSVVLTPRGRLYVAITRNGDTLLFADDHLFVHPGDLWTDIKTTSLFAEGGVGFKNGKKPLALLRRLIAIHPSKAARVLDFFAGSGTTAEAVLQLNAADGGTRSAVLVQSSENDIPSLVTRPRILNALEYLPGQLQYFRLTSD